MPDHTLAGLRYRLATIADAEKITELRTKAYQVATGSKLTNTGFLHWNQQDTDASIVMIEDEQGLAVSSMRGIKLNDISRLETQFDIIIKDPIDLPVLAVDKLVTSIEYRRQGLSAVLRLLLIEASLNSDINSIALTINDGASRVGLLKKLGFELKIADLSARTNSVFNNNCDVLFGVLSRSAFARAIDIACENLKYDLSSFNAQINFRDNLCRQIIER